MAETSTLTLTDFLLARIAEDEAEAERWARDPGEQCFECAGFSAPRPPDRLDYERWPAECEAKRRIVEGLTQDAPTMHEGLRERIEQGAVEWAWMVAREGTLAALALPYADHPDYREEWRP